MPYQSKLFFFSFVILGLLLTGLQMQEIHIEMLPTIIILALAAGWMEKFHVELPNGVELSGSSIFTLVVLIQIGTTEALIIDLIISLFLAVLYRLKFTLWLLNACQFSITVIITGYFMELVMVQNYDVYDLKSSLYFVLGTAIYIMVGYTLSSICISFLYSRKIIESWFAGLKDSLIGFGVTSILGLRLVSIYDPNEQIHFWIEAGFIFCTFLALRYAFKLFINLRKTYLTSMETITQFVEKKLKTASGHSTRVGKIARMIAEEMNMSQDEIDAIHYAAILHDIGKLQIKQGIFNKRGPLTMEEEKKYRLHPVLGAKMVGEVSGFSKSVEYIKYHHEQWDGKGYPEGKKGTDIPLGARIIAAANEYDYIIQSKNVKNPKQLFQQFSGKKLDPDLVHLMVRLCTFAPSTSPSEAMNEQLAEEKVIQTIHSKFNNSQLLRDFGAGQIVYLEADGVFTQLNGEETTVPCEEQVLKMISEESEDHQPKHEFLQDPVTKKFYNIHWITLDERIYVLFFDLSNVLEYETKQEAKIRKIYRDVIHSVTQGKLLLLELDELTTYYKEEKLLEVKIKEKEDVSKCRKSIEVILEDRIINTKTRYDILLTVSEAVTNILKHAAEGKMKVYLLKNQIRIIVEDQGNGIKLSDLPKSALLEGYSSKLSMGLGFGLMLKLMDKVALYTSKEGTTVILEAQLDK